MLSSRVTSSALLGAICCGVSCTFSWMHAADAAISWGRELDGQPPGEVFFTLMDRVDSSTWRTYTRDLSTALDGRDIIGFFQSADSDFHVIAPDATLVSILAALPDGWDAASRFEWSVAASNYPLPKETDCLVAGAAAGLFDATDPNPGILAGEPGVDRLEWSFGPDARPGFAKSWLEPPDWLGRIVRVLGGAPAREGAAGDGDCQPSCDTCHDHEYEWDHFGILITGANPTDLDGAKGPGETWYPDELGVPGFDHLDVHNVATYAGFYARGANAYNAQGSTDPDQVNFQIDRTAVIPWSDGAEGSWEGPNWLHHQSVSAGGVWAFLLGVVPGLSGSLVDEQALRRPGRAQAFYVVKLDPRLEVVGGGGGGGEYLRALGQTLLGKWIFTENGNLFYGRGDLNADGRIDGGDVDLLRSRFFEARSDATGAYDAHFDLDNDGVVGFADLGRLREEYLSFQTAEAAARARIEQAARRLRSGTPAGAGVGAAAASHAGEGRRSGPAADTWPGAEHPWQPDRRPGVERQRPGAERQR